MCPERYSESLGSDCSSVINKDKKKGLLQTLLQDGHGGVVKDLGGTREGTHNIAPFSSCQDRNCARHSHLEGDVVAMVTVIYICGPSFAGLLSMGRQTQLCKL